mmetsp:Transcript_43243/g.115684  ORF Transcript_43243/g.115684 Transcript_43243/m.115684 type:complete len:109 (+) Transcript_43243:82-408(+)
MTYIPVTDRETFRHDAPLQTDPSVPAPQNEDRVNVDGDVGNQSLIDAKENKKISKKRKKQKDVRVENELVINFAKYLGMDPDQDQEFFWIAQQSMASEAYVVVIPNSL